MSRTGNAVEGLVYHTLRWVLGTAARAYFSRIDVRHLERLPSRGPLLVAANHPASLTDVLLLGPALPRRLHFVAYSRLFEIWPLGLMLRLAGTVPIYRRQEGAEQMHRNEDTFRACSELLRAGGAVLIFPEGTSMGDRRVEQLRTGTARMALAYEFGERRGEPLTLLPIGVHFEDRAAFRSRVTLSVGWPVELASLREQAARDPVAAVGELTARLQTALEKLILNIPSQELARLVRDVERLYLADLQTHSPQAPELALGRAIADCIEFYRVHDRERLHQLWIAVNAYQRKLAALRLEDQAVRDAGAERRGARLAALAALGAIPAVAGATLHYVPYRLNGALGGVFASFEPTRIAFSRIITGLVLFPATYALYAWLLWRYAHWTAGPIALVLAACFPLGLYAHGYFKWLLRERQHLRVALVASTHARVVARLRAERRRLVRLLDSARDDYLAWVALTKDGPDPA